MARRTAKRCSSLISQASIQQWITNYESMGEDAFLMKSYKHYSAELKRKAVLDYLSGKGSQTDICKKYGIRSKSKLQKWIKKYNGHEELKSSGTGGSIIMTKGRKTTFEERVEIVQYCIAHNHNYARAISQVRIQDDLLGRQRFGGAVEHKEKIEDALSRFIETGLRIPLFNCRGRVACRHRVLA